MKYISFTIENYRAIKGPLTLNLSDRIIPLVGVNECGKTTILQALLCFDESNDHTAGGEHLKSTSNLYETSDIGESKVSAKIECDKKILKSIIDESLEDGLLDEEEETSVSEILEELLKNYSGELEITRHLERDAYSSKFFENLTDESQTQLCSKIVERCPFILYNDDFNDRPVSEIIIGSEVTPINTEWQSIFEKVFRDTNKSYTLAKVFTEKSERQDSILADVEAHLSSKLTKEWKKFSPEKPQIAIRLKLKTTSLTNGTTDKRLVVSIVETKNKRDRFFPITSRSKGFIWYYNFIMKVLFNPKESGSEKDTIFLLDEPGSYLHSTAQESLCKKLSEISGKAIVIYCTHAPQLLDIQYIPFNNIRIVKKTNRGHIQIASISDEKTTTKKSTALQPVYDALLIPEFSTINRNDRIICVEGIHDKYCLEIFCNLPDNVRILPGVNAQSILDNIQYLIAYKIPYIAIWDNDREGKLKHKTGIEKFGPMEANKFILLPEPNKDQEIRRMEEMLLPADYEYLKAQLKLDNQAEYPIIICTLWQLSAKNRKTIISGISEETKKTFDRFSKKISQLLN